MIMKPKLTLVVFAAALASTLLTAQARQGDPRADAQRARDAGLRVIEGVDRSIVPEGVGTIRYDPGAPDGVRFSDPPYSFVGNLFDTQSGQPLAPGSIYAVSWYHGPATSKGYANILIVPSSAGTGAVIQVNGVNSFATNVQSLASPLLVTPPFFVGLAVGPPQGEGQQFNQIGFRSASTNSQGFHGSQRPFSLGMRFARVPIPGQNISMRATGSVAIPVELLEFEVE